MFFLFIYFFNFCFSYSRLLSSDRKDCDAESKKKLMMELHDLIRGKAKQVSGTLAGYVKSRHSAIGEQRRYSLLLF